MVVGELLVDIVQLVAIILVAAGLGFFTHELLHWSTGYVSGGSPRFTDRIYGVPSAVIFDTPTEMTDQQVKWVGGIVLLFPLLFAFFALSLTLSQVTNSHFLTAVFGFLIGGCAVSPSDMMAFVYPSAWKKFANGEPISLSDFGY